MVPEFEQAAFEGEIGLYPTPVQTQFGYHVIEILNREERSFTPEEAMIEAGWYGRSELSDRFGALVAEVLFQIEVGQLSDPLPTEFGALIVELQERALRELDQAAQEAKRLQLFEQRIAEIQEEAVIENRWDPSMVPTGL
jgi:parvulin-like peptidyl-prolyl isomerase